MSGDPIAQSWTRTLPLRRLLQGHPLTSQNRMALAFTRTVEYHEPSGTYSDRSREVMDAVTLRRPQSVTSHLLPPLQVKVIQIDLEKDVIDASNRHFQHYQQAMQAMQASQGRNLDKAAVRGRSHLIRARLWLYHPGSVDLQDCGKSPTERSLILKGFSEANGDRVLLARGGKDILARSLPCATDFDPVPLGKPVVGGES